MTLGKLSMLERKSLAGFFSSTAEELGAVAVIEEILRLHEIEAQAVLTDILANCFEDEGLTGSANSLRRASAQMRSKA